jgi:hypothetical protein
VAAGSFRRGVIAVGAGVVIGNAEADDAGVGFAAYGAERGFDAGGEFPAGRAEESVFVCHEPVAAFFAENGENEVFEGKRPHGLSLIKQGNLYGGFEIVVDFCFIERIDGALVWRSELFFYDAEVELGRWFCEHVDPALDLEEGGAWFEVFGFVERDAHASFFEDEELHFLPGV